MSLTDLVLEEELSPPKSDLTIVGEGLYNQFRGKASAVIAYGSCVYGTQKPDSMKDFLIVVPNSREFYDANQEVTCSPSISFARNPLVQTALNRLGPNFHHIQEGKVKIGVISQSQFEKAPRKFSAYIAYRLTKPLQVVASNSRALPGEKIIEIIGSSRMKILNEALRLVPYEFTKDDLIRAYVSSSYLADVRPEDPNKVKSIIESSHEFFETISDSFLKNPQTAKEINDTNRLLTNVLVRLRKPFFLAHTLRQLFTARNPVGYAMRKVRLSKKPSD